MTHIFEFLSGGVPGGAILILAALIFTNLAIHFLFKSGLFTGSLLKKYVSLNFIVLSVYIILWVYNKPTPLPNRIIVLPSGNEQHFNLNASNLKLAEFFEQNGYALEGRYLTHKWRWMYNTLGEERVSIYSRWLELANNLKPDILITSDYNPQGDLVVNASFPGTELQNKEIVITKDDWDKGLGSMLTQLNLKKKKDALIQLVDEKYLAVELQIVRNKLAEAIKAVQLDSTRQGQLCYAQALVYKGLEFVYDQEKLNFVTIINPDFEKAKAILYPMVKSGYKTSQAAYLLGRMAIREQEYEGAEVFFKIAFSEELWNSDIYYYLSFLLPSRLEELGYASRKKILEKAVELNPGNRDAVYDLAERYYITGNGVEQGSGTQDALKTLENFLKLNDEDPKIQSLLATFYIKTDKLDQAETIYRDMAVKYPKDSNIIYNLGIIYYTRAQYDQALAEFKKAINMDNNLDAYLYCGITYEMLGNNDMALKYYRDRVRLKVSDDDQYAKEAMKAIRKILEERAYQNKDSLN